MLDTKRKKISIGDTIIFNYNDKSVSVLVDKLMVFNNFSEMLDKINLNEIGFANYSLDNVLFELNNIYPSNKLLDNKILAIKFHRINIRCSL